MPGPACTVMMGLNICVMPLNCKSRQSVSKVLLHYTALLTSGVMLQACHEGDAPSAGVCSGVAGGQQSGNDSAAPGDASAG